MNAKKELLDLLAEENLTLLAGIVGDFEDGYGKNHRRFILYPNYTQDDFTEFLKNIDFTYHDGYGGQELDGTLWFTDGTWADRGEYDGSEWWQHHVKPPLPRKEQS